MVRDREFDLVLLGATGFTGGLTARYLAEHAPQGLRWALAGRNEAKLQALGIDVPLLRRPQHQRIRGIGITRARHDQIAVFQFFQYGSVVGQQKIVLGAIDDLPQQFARIADRKDHLVARVFFEALGDNAQRLGKQSGDGDTHLPGHGAGTESRPDQG